MSKTINSDLIRGNINTIILKSLYGGDRYGYDIIKEIEEKSHGQYILKQPTLYSCLKRLESQGFVQSYWGEQSNGGRRKYYSLTDMGREVFVQNQDEYEFSRTIIDQLISERDYDLNSIEPSPSNTNEHEEDCDYYSDSVEAEADIETDDIINSTEYSNTVESTEEKTDDKSYETLTTVEITEETESPQSELQDESLIRQHVEKNDEKSNKVEQSAINENLNLCEQLAAEKKDNENSSSFIDILLSDNENSRSNSYSLNLKNTKFDSNDNSTKIIRQEPDYSDYFSTPVNEQYAFAFDEEEAEPTTTTTAAPNSTQSTDSAPKQDINKYPESEFLTYDTHPSYHYNPEEIPSTAVGNYKSILGELIDDFDTAASIPTEQSSQTEDKQIDSDLTEAPLSIKEQVQVRNFGKLSQSIRELGEEVKIRTPDSNAAREFNKQYYYYRNKLMLVHYGILFLIMLFESFLTYIIIKSNVKVAMGYDVALYVCTVLFCLAFPTTAGILFFCEPYKRKRVDFNFKSSMIFRVIIMLQLILIIYAINVYAGMPIGGDAEHLLSMLLPCILTTNVPLSCVIFNTLYRSKKFSVN